MFGDEHHTEEYERYLDNLEQEYGEGTKIYACPLTWPETYETENQL